MSKNFEQKNKKKELIEEEEISLSESDSDYIVDSFYDNIFYYNLIPNLNSFAN